MGVWSPIQHIQVYLQVLSTHGNILIRNPKLNSFKSDQPTIVLSVLKAGCKIELYDLIRFPDWMHIYEGTYVYVYPCMQTAQLEN